MKQALIKKGTAVAAKIPAPQVEDDKILVKVVNSCISVGTEMSGVATSGTPLWKRALNEPQNVKKVLDKLAADGLSKTVGLVKSKLDSGTPTGYSAAGEVIAAGKNIRDIKVGDRVACAGAQCAHHAEIINVPRNLTVKIPDEVTFADASVVTLGAIAMQGVRRANPTLGETVVVIGLGVIGQLTAQILKAAGCRVVVSDLDESRIETALKHGADYAIRPNKESDVETTLRLTDGFGADAVIVTAATSSDAVVSTAFRMCRKKGRVVVVGAVGLGLKREDIYQKELDFFISTSYGPGRYDEQYEERGLEYPIGYVRWTENRNMQEVLRLMAEKKLVVADMVSAVYPIDRVGEAYDSLKAAAEKPLLVLLSYPDNDEKTLDKIEIRAKAAPKDKIRVALIGAGGFAKGMHLPNMAKLGNLFELQAVMSRTGANAEATASQHGASYATTDYGKILADPEIDMVLITTRHNLHARMVLKALQAGKHVLVEKPLAISEAELSEIERFYGDNDHAPLLLTGFNRRHSRCAREIAKHTAKRIAPLIINYRMNAGYIPLDHWVHTEEGAGRNIGEACHIYDLFNFLTGAKAVEVSANSISPAGGCYSSKDNFVATVSYDDGSIATLTYTALGAKDYPKEVMDVYFDGKMISLSDYKSLTGYGVKIADVSSRVSDKGQLEELEAFGKAIKEGTASPIPLWQQLQAMRIAFAVEEAI